MKSLTDWQRYVYKTPKKTNKIKGLMNMRRKDREITDPNEIVEIIKKCDVCRIALFDDEYPYIIPLNFGYEKTEDIINLYFHCAQTGTKLDLIKKCNKVSFEMDCSHVLVTGEQACDYTMEFESVCGTGKIEILEEDEKINALNILMKQYSSKEKNTFDENLLKITTALRLTVKSITGKKLKQ